MTVWQSLDLPWICGSNPLSGDSNRASIRQPSRRHEFSNRRVLSMRYRARANSLMQSSTLVRQSGSAMPNRANSLAFDNREFAGRFAGVG